MKRDGIYAFTYNAQRAHGGSVTGESLMNMLDAYTDIDTFEKSKSYVLPLRKESPS